MGSAMWEKHLQSVCFRTARRPTVWKNFPAMSGRGARTARDDRRAPKMPPRVVRGGSWMGDADLARPVFFSLDEPLLRGHFTGFRVCSSMPPPSAEGTMD